MTIERLENGHYKATQKHAQGRSETYGEDRLSTLQDAIQSEYENFASKSSEEQSPIGVF